MTCCIFLLQLEYNPILFLLYFHLSLSLKLLQVIRGSLFFFFKRFIILRGDLRWFEIPTHISFTAIYQLYGFSIKYVREVSKFLLANGAQPFNQAINSLFSVYSIRRIHYLLNYKQRAYLFYLKLHNVFEILFLFFMATLLKMYVYKIKISFIQLTNVY